MCGIAGILSPQYDTKLAIKKLTNAIAHRGPDGEGYYYAEGIALGHRRLSIIDLSEQGAQPMFDNDKNLVIVYNGELYNYQILKQELNNSYEFKTQSDTEVILAAFKAWGPECLQKLNGIFAFAIWNIRMQKLFIARDPMGIKPFYYYRTEKGILFASELTALLASDIVPRKISRQGITDFFLYQSVHEPETLISNAYQLRAGHYAWISSSSFIPVQYWNITDIEPFEKTDYKSVCKQVSLSFYQSVVQQLVSDVPLAVFLSGGIDSTAVVAAASLVSENKINTFSIGFNEAKYDESKYARIIANKYNTHHQECKVDAKIFIEQLPDALDAMSTPSGDGPNTFLISKLVREQGIKVALTGLGGDELFAGYTHFNSYYKLNNFRNKVPAWIRQIIGNFLLNTPNRKIQKMAELLALPDLNLDYAYPIFRRIFTSLELEYLDPILKLYPDVVASNLISMHDEIDHLPVYSRYSVAELQNYTMNVLLEDADQMSMANGLELRVPFLDKDLVKYVLSIPDHFKHPVTPKKLLVDSLYPNIPEEIVNRKKMGFNLPWDIWMRNELKGFCEIRIQSLAKRGLFKPEVILKMWRSFLANIEDIQWFKIWLLVVLEHWMAKNNIEE